MALGERQKRKVAAAQRRLRVRDDGAQARDAPARADQRRGGGMLPAFQLRHTKRDDVGVEKRAAPLQRGEQAAIDDGERRFECFGVGAAGERERLPSQLSQVLLIPRGFQFGGALRDEELLVAGHTDADAGRCEVTRALVAVRKLTGRVAASSKFSDPEEPTVIRALDEAQRIFEEEKDRLEPVVVI